jgi:hypothetical protein
LYWQLGQEIVIKQKESNWGKAIIDRLSKDLTAAFPGMKGFSRANLFFIRNWFLFYQPLLISLCLVFIQSLVLGLGENN